MNHLFFAGLKGVGERILASPHVLLALDYDGTLTPIVNDPQDAWLAPSVRNLLGALSRRSDSDVAIVSGRAHGDLQNRVGMPHLIYASNHGSEITGPGMLFIDPGAQAAAQTLHEMALQLADRLRPIAGAAVEDKGLTLSIHHRRVAPVDIEEVWRAVLQAVEPVSDRFHITPGLQVYEVRPRVRWDKGAAVAWIKEHLGKNDSLVIYIGDDATDEDAFVALGSNAITIKVGNSATATAARFFVPSPAEVHDFLTWVHALLQEKKRER